MTQRNMLLCAVVDFLCMVAVTLIATAPKVPNVWIGIPALLFVGTMGFLYASVAGERYRRIQAQLELLLCLLPPPTADIRCTFHYPFPGVLPIWLKQAFEYVTQGTGGGGGRRHSIRKGIIGTSYHEKEAKVENFGDQAEFRQKMVDVYGYTRREMQKATSDRRSYLAVPILDERHRVLGLLYFDSSTPGTFVGNPNDPKRKLIQDAIPIVRAQLT